MVSPPFPVDEVLALVAVLAWLAICEIGLVFVVIASSGARLWLPREKLPDRGAVGRVTPTRFGLSRLRI